ncbi:MAG: acetoin dehydrogenase dihydrolipoyllysine-residue acetyltransferase subunit [Sphingomonadales bacterium]
MAITPILMPKWGLAMEEGTPVEWLKAEGDTVAEGEELVEIETSKITNVMEATDAGPLRRIVADVGEALPVGALIGVIAEEADSDDAIDAFITDFQANFIVAADSGDEASGPETITVDGSDITYQRVDGGDGTPVIMVHGYGGDRDNWLFNQDALAADRDVIALDLPGHGGSTKDIKDPSLKGLAKLVNDFAGALGLETYHLMGHSMGGAVALEAASQAGGAVVSVVTVCPAGLSAKVNSDFIDTFLAAERRKGMKQAALMLFADKDLVTRDLVNNLLQFKRIDGVNEALVALRDGAIADANTAPIDVSAIAAPVCIIIGEEDEVIPPSGDAPSGAQVVKLPVGHMAHMEDAAAVNKAAVAHFNQVG